MVCLAIAALGVGAGLWGGLSKERQKGHTAETITEEARPDHLAFVSVVGRRRYELLQEETLWPSLRSMGTVRGLRLADTPR